MEGLLVLQDFAVVLLVAGVAGLLFRRLGLSAVVGYLVAGIVVGPYSPPFQLVSDLDRIHTLSQFGLVFLMFFVGMSLSLSRIRRLGPGMILAVLIAAFLVFNFSRVFAFCAGWNGTSGIFFAAMLMVSSSAIISKMLAEGGMTHEKSGQRAQGVTVIEDVVLWKIGCK